MFTHESISKELKRINDSVPDLIKEFTLIKKEKHSVIEFVMRKALEEPNISEEKKKRLRKALATGIFNQTTIAENPDVAKQRDDWVTREIKKSVKAGRLPTKKQLKELGLDKIENIYGKKINDKKRLSRGMD